MNIEAINGYHAHVYYEPSSRRAAEALRSEMKACFPAAIYGRWHERPVGPHPSCMFQVAFSSDLLATIFPWLILNHGALTIFLHPSTGDSLSDHTRHAVWIGRQQHLILEAFGEQ
jgi:aromatic ring-cleaving dioxygenase